MSTSAQSRPARWPAAGAPAGARAGRRRRGRGLVGCAGASGVGSSRVEVRTCGWDDRSTGGPGGVGAAAAGAFDGRRRRRSSVWRGELVQGRDRTAARRRWPRSARPVARAESAPARRRPACRGACGADGVVADGGALRTRSDAAEPQRWSLRLSSWTPGSPPACPDRPPLDRTRARAHGVARRGAPTASVLEAPLPRTSGRLTGLRRLTCWCCATELVLPDLARAARPAPADLPRPPLRRPGLRRLDRHGRGRRRSGPPRPCPPAAPARAALLVLVAEAGRAPPAPGAGAASGGAPARAAALRAGAAAAGRAARAPTGVATGSASTCPSTDDGPSTAWTSRPTGRSASRRSCAGHARPGDRDHPPAPGRRAGPTSARCPPRGGDLRQVDLDGLPSGSADGPSRGRPDRRASTGDHAVELRQHGAGVALHRLSGTPAAAAMSSAPARPAAGPGCPAGRSTAASRVREPAARRGPRRSTARRAAPGTPPMRHRRGSPGRRGGRPRCSATTCSSRTVPPSAPESVRCHAQSPGSAAGSQATARAPGLAAVRTPQRTPDRPAAPPGGPAGAGMPSGTEPQPRHETRCRPGRRARGARRRRRRRHRWSSEQDGDDAVGAGRSRTAHPSQSMSTRSLQGVGAGPAPARRR
jgi:hypothetical protein